MLIQTLVTHPQMLGPVLQNTPTWVWGLLTGLAALGLTQIRTRSAGLTRITAMPLTMTALSVWGLASSFSKSPQFGYMMLAWMGAALAAMAAVAPLQPPAGTKFDAATRRFVLPGSWIPMLLILAIFLTKYVVGVDLAMQPPLALDRTYTLSVGTLYGIFTGIFLGRAARVWRLAAARSSNRIDTAAANT